MRVTVEGYSFWVTVLRVTVLRVYVGEGLQFEGYSLRVTVEGYSFGLGGTFFGLRLGLGLGVGSFSGRG